MLALLAVLSTAAAQDCDAAALRAAYDEASPVAVAGAWTALARCDEAQGRRTVKGALDRMLAGDEAHEALVVASAYDVDDEIHAWLAGLEPGHRSKAIAALGAACAQSEPVHDFLVGSMESMGDAFWEERWYRALADCPTEPVQQALEAQVDARAAASGAGRSQFLGVLEAYSRNLGAAAIPKLSELAGKLEAPDELVYVVNAFGDTADVGAVEGVDAETAPKAVEALTALGPQLPPRAVDQARTILLALGDQEASDRMAAWRWPDRMSDGAYTYGLAVRELATCKNGKLYATLHVAELKEPGHRWPDQLEAALRERLPAAWEMDTAQKCKGEAEITVATSPEPWGGDAEAQQDWLEAQRKAFAAASEGAKKAEVMQHEPFLLE